MIEDSPYVLTAAKDVKPDEKIGHWHALFFSLSHFFFLFNKIKNKIKGRKQLLGKQDHYLVRLQWFGLWELKAVSWGEYGSPGENILLSGRRLVVASYLFSRFPDLAG